MDQKEHEKNRQARSEAFLTYEQEAFEALGKAMEAFSKLVSSHPSHTQDFVDGIHKCQSVLGQRVLQRDHPRVFASFAPKQYNSKMFHAPIHAAHILRSDNIRTEEWFSLYGDDHDKYRNPHYDVGAS